VGSIAALRRSSYATALLIIGLLPLVFLLFLVVVDARISAASAAAGMLLLLLVAGFFMLLQWLISPWLVRRAARVKEEVTESSNPWLHRTVAELAAQAEIPPPRIWLSADASPNAFVFGRTISSAELVVTQGLLQALNQDEIRAVLAHEVGHLRHRDVIIMTVLSAVPLLAYIVARGCFEFLRHSGGGDGKGKGQAMLVAVIVAVAAYLVYAVTQVLVLHLSRTRELYADAYSGAATRDPHQLASALTKISFGLSLVPRGDQPTGLRAFMIGDPVKAASDYEHLRAKMARYDLDQDGQLDLYELEEAYKDETSGPWRRANELFSTHPPTYARILLLELLEEELATGGLPANVYEYL
jgi:heat shock protein HtpX